MHPDRNSKHVHDLSAAIEESRYEDRPPQWRPAFAAADTKAQKQALLDQLKERFGLDGGTDSDSQPDAGGGSVTQVASANGSNGFADLVRGWLGRA
jgi:hypothetical protein